MLKLKNYLLIAIVTLVGCGKCPESERRAYRYGDKATIIAGFYKNSKGTITKETQWHSKKRNGTLLPDNFCTSPSFYVKLEDGNEIHIQQNKLFVDR